METLKAVLDEIREPLAIFGLIVIAVISIVILGKDGIPIVTGCAGALGGILVGKKL